MADSRTMAWEVFPHGEAPDDEVPFAESLERAVPARRTGPIPRILIQHKRQNHVMRHAQAYRRPYPKGGELCPRKY